ncbi:MAG TPA: helix-hairpin-helix domain-containing protein [Anaerolineaceae bacterium]|nr:helix-hairpin-helix domain-containing protein [Anaerolineaceae bacterium]
MRDKSDSSETLSEGGSRPLRWLFFIFAAALGAVVVWVIRDQRKRELTYSGRREINVARQIAAERTRATPQAPVSTFPPPNQPVNMEIVIPEPEALPVQPDAAQTGIPDDLKRIEGIGPVYEKTLRAAGIDTFSQLAEISVDRLRAIFEDRPLADPTSWPEQAALAARGDWDGLERLRMRLRGGRRQNA